MRKMEKREKKRNREKRREEREREKRQKERREIQKREKEIKREEREKEKRERLPKIVHGSSGDQRFLRVVQHVSQGIHAHVEVGNVDAHGLLTHSGLTHTQYNNIIFPCKIGNKKIENTKKNICNTHKIVTFILFKKNLLQKNLQLKNLSKNHIRIFVFQVQAGKPRTQKIYIFCSF